MSSRWLALAVLTAITLLISGCTSPSEGTGGSGKEKAGFSLKVYREDGGLALDKYGLVETGLTALEAMEALVPVEYTESAYGAFVTSINGVSAGEGYYWALYVDGEYASQGIGQYIVQENMAVEWKQEKIEAFGLT